MSDDGLSELNAFSKRLKLVKHLFHLSGGLGTHSIIESVYLDIDGTLIIYSNERRVEKTTQSNAKFPSDDIIQISIFELKENYIKGNCIFDTIRRFNKDMDDNLSITYELSINELPQRLVIKN